MTGRRRSVLFTTITMTVGSLVAMATLTVAGSVNAGEHRVAVGEVRSEVARGGIDMPALVRSTAETELAKIEGRTKGKRRAVLSIALLEMETTTGPKGALDTCRMVATIRDASKGALLATFETNAKAPHGADASRTSMQSDRAMVQSAVQGIVRRVPEALK